MLYEICQNISLRNEQALVVVDAALGARYIADLVDLPRLKILVAGLSGQSSSLTESLRRFDLMDQIEVIEGEPGPCELLIMDMRTMRSWGSMQRISARLLLVTASGHVNDSQKGWLSAQGFSQLGEKLWAFQNQRLGRNHPCPCGSGKRYKHCHGALL
jgi:hypothetical protein